MNTFFFPEDEGNITRDSCVVLGNFDGVHQGHQKLMEKAVAEAQGLQTVAYTFDRHPRLLLGKPVRVITSNMLKEAYIQKMGIDVLVFQRLEKAFLELSPEDFVEKILVGKLHAKKVIVGTHYTFGRNGEGTSGLLTRLCAKWETLVEIVPLEEREGGIVSSTRIRQAVAAGDVELAGRLLGHDFQIEGEIVHGNQIGRTMGFPTINICPPKEQLLPAFGVYAAGVQLDGKRYRGIANVGNKPTVASDRPLVEVHLFDAEGDFYGKHATVDFYHFLRKETKFDSLCALQQQIASDIQRAEEYFKG